MFYDIQISVRSTRLYSKLSPTSVHSNPTGTPTVVYWYAALIIIERYKRKNAKNVKHKPHIFVNVQQFWQHSQLIPTPF